jgi:hypothetical protein
VTSYKNYKIKPIKESLYDLIMFSWHGLMGTNDKEKGKNEYNYQII